jgi:regulatory protein
MAIVTALRPARRRAGYLELWLDGRRLGDVPESVALSSGLAVGSGVDQTLEEELRSLAQLSDALNLANAFLGHRPRSEAEVRTRLRRAGHQDQRIDAVVEDLTRRGLLNDQRFGALWVESRQSFSPRSERLLAHELRGKGLDRQDIDDVLAAAGVDEDAQAAAAARGRIRTLASLEEPEFRKRLTAYLGRRGFAFETADRAAKSLWAELHPD